MRQQRRRFHRAYPSDIISEWLAKSSRSAERHQIGLVGDIIPDSRATSLGSSMVGVKVEDQARRERDRQQIVENLARRFRVLALPDASPVRGNLGRASVWR